MIARLSPTSDSVRLEKAGEVPRDDDRDKRKNVHSTFEFLSLGSFVSGNKT